MILRLTVGLSGLADGISIALLHTQNGPVPWGAGILELLLGIVLVLGFLTPIAASVAAIRTLYVGLPLFAIQEPALHRGAIPFLYLAIMCVVLALMGPGGFSIDARLFGRREITIPKSLRNQ